MGVQDTIQLQGRVGAITANDGSSNSLRQDKTGALVTAAAHGSLYEPASRGKLFFANTAAAGVAPGTALSTAPAMTVWNPTASGILVSIKKVYLGYISGTLGAGSMVHSYVPAGSQPAAPTGGTAIVPVNALLNGAGGVAKAYTGPTIAITSLLLRASAILGASLATTAYQPGFVQDDVDGSIVLSPGAAWCYQGIAAAGSTPLVSIGVVYEEITTP